jgi:heme exporter protein CcmD
LLLLQTPAPPDNVAYLILGYALTGLLLAGIILALLLRRRRLRAELAELEALLEETRSK